MENGYDLVRVRDLNAMSKRGPLLVDHDIKIISDCFDKSSGKRFGQLFRPQQKLIEIANLIFISSAEDIPVLGFRDNDEGGEYCKYRADR